MHKYLGYKNPTRRTSDLTSFRLEAYGRSRIYLLPLDIYTAVA